MNISSISNFKNSFPKVNRANNKSKDVSFGSIYVERNVDLGRTADSRFPPKLNRRDELLFNEIAQLYPNQDCFIRRGYSNYPRLEFREKPASLQVFTPTLADQYKIDIEPRDEENPCVELLLTKSDKISNRIIGLQNYIAMNPSLAFTISAGFEVHKQMLDRKYTLLQLIGNGDEVDLGGKTVSEAAYEEIKPIEIAVKRYLLECAYAAIKDRASAAQIYGSNLPKVQTRLEANRKLDLTTSVADRVPVLDEELTKDRIDICEVATVTYPNMKENEERIKKLERFMRDKSLIF
ncbi:MAG: hypothetical protein IJY61_01580 [Candidatus Gastranaerophilales bacterium]|nr:hypothetical protein [Candidatus Gastranaerophilales bacterium]